MKNSAEGVVRSHQDGVTTIRLNREAEHNRIDPADVMRLRSLFAEVAEGGCIALILTGTGSKTFSSGYTLSALERGEIDASFEAMLNELEALPVLTICMLNGSVQDHDQLAARTAAYIDALRNCEPDVVRSMKLQLNAIARGDTDAATTRHHYEASLRSPRLAENLAKRRK